MFVPSPIIKVKAKRPPIMGHLEGTFLRLACARLEKLASDKHTGLLRKFVIYGRKKFYNIGPPKNLKIKKITVVIY